MPASASPNTPFAALSPAVQLKQLTLAFEGCFLEMNTVLMRAEDFHGPEPIYLPAAGSAPAKIGYAHGFVRSLLHEAAHWTVAGKPRLTQIDYGYWYAPDGRNPDQQRAFEAAEIKPQAIEWLCCQALGIGFEPSLDNLHLVSGGAPSESEYDGGAGFQLALKAQHQRFTAAEDRLPPRAARWITCLHKLSAAPDNLQTTSI